MATNDPAEPNNPNAGKTPSVADSGTAKNDTDPNGNIKVNTPTPGSHNTSYAGSGNKQDDVVLVDSSRAASSGIMHSSFRNFTNPSGSTTEEYALEVHDVPSSNTPVAPITERREISRRTTYGPGQNPGVRPGASPINPGPSQVALSPNDLKTPSDVVSQTVWQPGQEGVVSDGSRVITNNLTSYPSAGETLTDSATRANPSADLTAREASGAHTQDPNAETFQGDYRGERKEHTAWQPQASTQKTDVSGRPVNKEVLVNEGAAGTARTADFKMFDTPAIPRDGKKLRSAIQGASANQPFSANEFQSFKGRESGTDAFSAEAGSFYGVAESYVPLDLGSETAVLGPASINGLTLVAKTMPAALITDGKVTSVSADFRNTTESTHWNNITVKIDVYDSAGKKHSLVNTVTNIPAGTAVAISEPLPPSIPLGPLSVVARATNTIRAEVISSRFDTIVVPASFGSQKFGKGERLPKSVRNALGLKNVGTPSVKGRAYPITPGRLLEATATRITGALKISQKAADDGFEPKISVSVNGATATEHTDKVKVGSIDVDPLTHQVAFDISGVTIGHTVEIVVEDKNGALKPSFAWALFTEGLQAKSGLSGFVVGDGTYIGGTISTDITDGAVVIENTRTGTRSVLNTDSDGAAIFEPKTKGLSSPSTESVQRFDAQPLDTIKVFSPNGGGAYTENFLTITAATATAGQLSTDASTASIRQPDNESPILEPRFPQFVR